MVAVNSGKKKVRQFQGSNREPGGGRRDVMVLMNVAVRANTTEAQRHHSLSL